MTRNIFIKILICSMFIFILSNLFCIQSSYALESLFADGKGFLESGKSIDETIDTTQLKTTSDYIYNTLLAIAVIVAVGVAMILGIQFMVASADEKAKVKEAIMPFTVGCIVVFGSFTIWKIAVNIGNDSENTIVAHKIVYDPIAEDGDKVVTVGSGNNIIQMANGELVDRDGPPPKECIPSGYTGSYRSWFGSEYHEYWDMDGDGDIDMDDYDIACGDWDDREGVIAKMPDSCFDSDGDGILEKEDGNKWNHWTNPNIEVGYQLLSVEVERRVQENAAGVNYVPTGTPPKQPAMNGYLGSFRRWYKSEPQGYWDVDKDGDIDMDDFDIAADNVKYSEGIIGKMPDTCLDSNGNGILDEGDKDKWDKSKNPDVNPYYEALSKEIKMRLWEDGMANSNAPDDQHSGG